MSKKKIQTFYAPAAIGPYSQAIRAADLLFLSGQIPLDPQTGQVVGQDIEAQAHRVMQNIGALLQAEGLGFGALVRVGVYLSDMKLFPRFNKVYAQYVSEPYPARATVAVSALPLGVLVEVEAIALCRS